MQKPLSVDCDVGIDQVIEKLLTNNFNRILISENNKITSLVTLRDIVFFLIYDSSNRTINNITIDEIAIPITSVDHTSTIANGAKTMLENGFGSLGVISENKIVGIVTKTDLVRYFASKHLGKKLVGEYMSPYYLWLYDDASFFDLIRKLYEENITRIIVRDQDELPVGIITLTDILRTTFTDRKTGMIKVREDSFRAIFPKDYDPKKETIQSLFAQKHAYDIMNRNIITVRYDYDLAKACDTILENNINGVGVLSGKGNLIGILSKTDVIKALAYIE